MLGCDCSSDEPEDVAGATWVKTWSVAGADLEPLTTVATEGGSYHLSLLTRTSDEEAAQALALHKVDDQGNVLWARAYGDSRVSASLTTIVCAVEASDGNIWIAGDSTEGATVVKLDADGARLGRFVYGTPEARVDVAACAATVDGGFVLAGSLETETDLPMPGGDLWVMRADGTGTSVLEIIYRRVDAPELTKPSGIFVEANQQITVTGQQDEDFWVAQFSSEGALKFSERFSGLTEHGFGRAVTIVPRVAESNVDRPGFVAVGANFTDSIGSPAGTWNAQIVYGDLPGAEPGAEPLIHQDEDIDLGGGSGFGDEPYFIFRTGIRDVALANDPNAVIVAGNTQREGQHTGVIAELVRRVDPSGHPEFEVGKTLLATELSGSLDLVERSLVDFDRTASGDYVALLRGFAPDFAHVETFVARVTADLESGEVTGAAEQGLGIGLDATSDGGVLLWSEGWVARRTASGEERWRQSFRSAAPTATAATDVAALADGGALLSANTPDGAVLLKYDRRGALRAARQFRELILYDLEPIARGRAGDAVVAIASALGDPERSIRLIRFDQDASPIDAVRVLGDAFASSDAVSRSDDRIVVPTTLGALWLDAAGAPLEHWTLPRGPESTGFRSRVRGTPAGGLWWLVERSIDGRTVVRRYGRGGETLAASSVGLALSAGSSFGLAGMVARADGGFFLTGVVTIDRSGQSCGAPSRCADGLVMSFDPRGRPAWAQAYGGGRFEQFNRLVPVATVDNGVLLGGVTHSYEFPRSSVFAARLDANGIVTADCVARSPLPLEQLVEEVPAMPVGISTPAPETVDAPTLEQLPVESPTLDLIAGRTCAGQSAAPTLRVEIVGDGRVVTSTPGIECPGDCEQSYATNSVVTLNAVPNGSTPFASWAGDCDALGQSATGELTVDRSLSCTAVFAERQDMMRTDAGLDATVDAQVDARADARADAEPMMCQTDPDTCPSGQRCADGRCVLIGDSCASTSDCDYDAGERCVGATGEGRRDGVCQMKPPCMIDSDCVALDDICTDGLCSTYMQNPCGPSGAFITGEGTFPTYIRGQSNATPSCGDAASGPETNFTIPMGTGILCVDTMGAGYDTVLYTRSEACTATTEIACNDDAVGNESRLEVDATSAEVYLIVDGNVPRLFSMASVHVTAGPCP